jgi:hypothetical protein
MSIQSSDEKYKSKMISLIQFECLKVKIVTYLGDSW